MSELVSFEKAGEHCWDLQAIVMRKEIAKLNYDHPYLNLGTDNIVETPTSGNKLFQVQENATIILNELEQLCNPFQPIDSLNKTLINNDTIDSSQSNKIVAPKRRKNKHKMTLVEQANGDRILSDKWNWRKYGEKVIKGSPYPRSYYRCSNSGGCSARKQVEQSSSDPGIFLITYIGDHCHPYPTRRPSQAGRSSRRFNVAAKAAPSGHSIVMSTKTTITTPSATNGEVYASNGAFEDDFLAGLEYLEGLEMAYSHECSFS